MALNGVRTDLDIMDEKKAAVMKTSGELVALFATLKSQVGSLTWTGQGATAFGAVHRTFDQGQVKAQEIMNSCAVQLGISRANLADSETSAVKNHDAVNDAIASAIAGVRGSMTGTIGS